MSQNYLACSSWCLINRSLLQINAVKRMLVGKCPLGEEWGCNKSPFIWEGMGVFLNNGWYICLCTSVYTLVHTDEFQSSINRIMQWQNRGWCFWIWWLATPPFLCINNNNNNHNNNNNNNNNKMFIPTFLTEMLPINRTHSTRSTFTIFKQNTLNMTSQTNQCGVQSGSLLLD